MKKSLLIGLFAFTLLPACGVEPGAVEDGAELATDDGKADAVASTSTYYTVRPDMRRCASPVCTPASGT